MLVLKRRKGDRIVINDNIVIEVSELKGGGVVSLAFDAPRHVSIHREEVYHSIRRDGGRDKHSVTMSKHSITPG